MSSTHPALEGVVVSAPKAQTIFGREPAAFLGLIEAALAVLVAFSLGVTNESAGLLTAFVSLAIGAYSAWATKDTTLGVWTGLAKAFLALVAYYGANFGLNLTDTQTVALVTLVPIIVGAFQRTQTSPAADDVVIVPDAVDGL